MNETKWEELRLEMFRIGPPAPAWRTKDVESGYVSEWDREWFYHFRLDGYRTIEWVEIKAETVEEELAILEILKKIHVPGTKTENGFKVLGYSAPGVAIEYL
jgi:hypothetical protein